MSFDFDTTEGLQTATDKRTDPVLGNILTTEDGREWVLGTTSTLVYRPLGKGDQAAAAAIPTGDEDGDGDDTKQEGEAE